MNNCAIVDTKEGTKHGIHKDIKLGKKQGHINGHQIRCKKRQTTRCKIRWKVECLKEEKNVTN